MNDTVEPEEEYDTNSGNPYGKYSICTMLILIGKTKLNYESIIYLSNNIAAPNVSLGSIFNSSAAILEQNSTDLRDANTSTENSEFDITTSVVPTTIGKVQTIQFSRDLTSNRLCLNS